MPVAPVTLNYQRKKGCQLYQDYNFLLVFSLFATCHTKTHKYTVEATVTSFAPLSMRGTPS